MCDGVGRAFGYETFFCELCLDALALWLHTREAPIFFRLNFFCFFFPFHPVDMFGLGVSVLASSNSRPCIR